MSTPEETVRAWAAAEACGDAAALAPLLDADFRGIGPHGFVLDRAQWLDRFEQGFAVERLTIEEVTVRERGDTAVVVGVQDQAATYRGNPSHGRFRVAWVLHHGAAGWTVLGAQLSGPMPA